MERVVGYIGRLLFLRALCNIGTYNQLKSRCSMGVLQSSMRVTWRTILSPSGLTGALHENKLVVCTRMLYNAVRNNIQYSLQPFPFFFTDSR